MSLASLDITLITYGPSFHDAIAYFGSDYTRCQDSRTSTSGYVILWKKGPILWRSKLQKAVAGFTWEAEYKATYPTLSHINTFRQLPTDLGSPQSNLTALFINTFNAVHTAQNFHPTSNYNNWMSGTIILNQPQMYKIKHVPSASNAAESLIKLPNVFGFL